VYPTYEEARARFVVRPPQPQPPADVLDPVAEYGLRQVPGGWSFKQDPAGFPPLYSDGVPEAAAAVRIPVTVVSGELSDVVTPDIVARAETIMPTAAFVRLPGVHHHLTLEAPAECARLIDDVGRRLSAP
jgi:pimeloyl-ACP methyl ester carboxylesterase